MPRKTDQFRIIFVHYTEMFFAFYISILSESYTERAFAYLNVYMTVSLCACVLMNKLAHSKTFSLYLYAWARASILHCSFGKVNKFLLWKESAKNENLNQRQNVTEK